MIPAMVVKMAMLMMTTMVATASTVMMASTALTVLHP
jgi:hypothetical protein